LYCYGCNDTQKATTSSGPATERSDPLQRLLLIKNWDYPLRFEQGPL
jgi:hypothetical protein